MWLLGWSFLSLRFLPLHNLHVLINHGSDLAGCFSYRVFVQVGTQYV